MWKIINWRLQLHLPGNNELLWANSLAVSWIEPLIVSTLQEVVLLHNDWPLHEHKRSQNIHFPYDASGLWLPSGNILEISI